MKEMSMIIGVGKHWQHEKLPSKDPSPQRTNKTGAGTSAHHSYRQLNIKHVLPIVSTSSRHLLVGRAM